MTRPRHWTARTLLLTSACALCACGAPTAPVEVAEPLAAPEPVAVPEEAAPEANAAPPTAGAGTHFEGTLGSGPLEPKSAVFMWRPNADDMQLMFADVPDLCGIVSAGAFPRGARLLSMTLKLNDERTHPAFSAGDYPVRGEGERAPRDIKRATFTELDGGCQPRLRTQAQSGVVQLMGDAVSKDTSAHGEIDLTFPEGSLKGTFKATFCTPPEMEPRGCK